MMKSLFDVRRNDLIKVVLVVELIYSCVIVVLLPAITTTCLKCSKTVRKSRLLSSCIASICVGKEWASSLNEDSQSSGAIRKFQLTNKNRD